MNVSMQPLHRQNCKTNAIMWAEKKVNRPVPINGDLTAQHNRVENQNDNKMDIAQMYHSIKNTESYIRQQQNVH